MDELEYCSIVYEKLRSHMTKMLHRYWLQVSVAVFHSMQIKQKLQLLLNHNLRHLSCVSYEKLWWLCMQLVYKFLVWAWTVWYQLRRHLVFTSCLLVCRVPLNQSSVFATCDQCSVFHNTDWENSTIVSSSYSLTNLAATFSHTHTHP